MVIYMTTNLINNKKYIGKDSNNNPKYLGGGIYLKKAFKKYGKKNFKKETLEECNNPQELKEREIYWLEFYNVKNNPSYYNATNNSCGAVHTEESKKSISRGMKGKNPYKDKTLEEMEEISKKKSISMLNGGAQILSEKFKGREVTWNEKLRVPKSVVSAKKGIPLSDETKHKISKSLTGRRNTWCTGEKTTKAVDQFSLEYKFIQTYNSIAAAAKNIGIDPAGISNVCRGKQKTAGGYIWKFKKQNKAK